VQSAAIFSENDNLFGAGITLGALSVGNTMVNIPNRNYWQWAAAFVAVGGYWAYGTSLTVPVQSLAFAKIPKGLGAMGIAVGHLGIPWLESKKDEPGLPFTNQEADEQNQQQRRQNQQNQQPRQGNSPHGQGQADGQVYPGNPTAGPANIYRPMTGKRGTTKSKICRPVSGSEPMPQRGSPQPVAPPQRRMSR
jgi:hypothetical protein